MIWNISNAVSRLTKTPKNKPFLKRLQRLLSEEIVCIDVILHGYLKSNFETSVQTKSWKGKPLLFTLRKQKYVFNR